jgi:glycopeptide antibiotics resistance protein
MALLAYGTLLPFAFDARALLADTSTWLGAVQRIATSPTWPRYSFAVSSLGLAEWESDLLMNLLVYLPLGALWRMDFRRRRWARPVQLLAAVVCAGLFSYALECTQSLAAGRYGSWLDLIYNTSGALIGAFVAPTCFEALRRSLFKVYCLIDYPLHRFEQRLFRLELTRPVHLGLAIATMIGVGWWIYSEVNAGSSSTRGMVFWMPFSAQFLYSYDVGLWVLGKSLFGYLLIAVALWVQLALVQRQGVMHEVTIATVTIVIAKETLQWSLGGRSADVTEPIVAIFAALLLGLGLYAFGRSVATGCRRSSQQPVAFDRRRRPHRYEPGPAGRR